MAIIGIDLGTTNSLAAYWTEQGPQLVKNALGKTLTPSVVSIKDGQIVVGSAAKDRLITHPHDSVANFKRKMGSNSQFKLGSKKFRPEELSSFILQQLKQDAENQLGEPVTEAVISVPAYFNDAQRKATKLAGELAGLKVERLINEPTAAAIAYGVHERKDEHHFLIVDLGGGTFDVSVLELFDDIMEVHATAGDNYLGGEDFTDILLNDIAEKNQFKLKDMDSRFCNSLRKQAESLKLQLSGKQQAELQTTISDKTIEYTIDQHNLFKLAEPLIERLRAPIERAIRDSQLTPSELNDVILVGGATRMPLIKTIISKMFRRLPSCNLNPDEVVALGTAVQAALKQRNQALRDVVLTDVCPYTLGVEVVREVGKNQHQNGYFHPIIERNSTIPVSKVDSLVTVQDEQNLLRCAVYQGESRLVKNNVFLGELEVKIPKNKAGQETVNIRYTYDINGILEVEVEVVSTGEKVCKIIHNSDCNLTQEQIKESFKKLESIKIHPRDQQENIALMARAERLYEESLADKRHHIADLIAWFENILNQQDLKAIEEARQQMLHHLDELEEFIFE